MTKVRKRTYGNSTIIGDDDARESAYYTDGRRVSLSYEAINSLAMISVGHSQIPVIDDDDNEILVDATPIREFSTELLRDMLLSRINLKKQEQMKEPPQTHMTKTERGTVLAKKNASAKKSNSGGKTTRENKTDEVTTISENRETQGSKNAPEPIHIRHPVITLTDPNAKKGYETGSNPFPKTRKSFWPA